MNINDLSKPIPIDKIDFRVQSINKADVRLVGIYKITSPSGKIYVGQSNNIAKRIKD